MRGCSGWCTAWRPLTPTLSPEGRGSRRRVALGGCPVDDCRSSALFHLVPARLHLAPPRRRPGPNWKGCCHNARPASLLSPNWAPAFAGVVPLGVAGLIDPPLRHHLCGRSRTRYSGHPFLFSREGGSPVWVPAFAGKHSDWRLLT